MSNADIVQRPGAFYSCVRHTIAGLVRKCPTHLFTLFYVLTNINFFRIPQQRGAFAKTRRSGKDRHHFYTSYCEVNCKINLIERFQFYHYYFLSKLLTFEEKGKWKLKFSIVGNCFGNSLAIPKVRTRTVREPVRCEVRTLKYVVSASGPKSALFFGPCPWSGPRTLCFQSGQL